MDSMGINCSRLSPLIIYSSSFELCYHKSTVIFCSALPSLSLSSKVTNYFSVSWFFSMPDWAALITEFSMAAAFSGLTVLIFITLWINVYICPWLRGWGVVSKWPASAPRLPCITMKCTVAVAAPSSSSDIRSERSPSCDNPNTNLISKLNH